MSTLVLTRALIKCITLFLVFETKYSTSIDLFSTSFFFLKLMDSNIKIIYICLDIIQIQTLHINNVVLIHYRVELLQV